MRLGAARWPDLVDRITTSTLAVPLGATEQHGPHLPLSTDTDLAVALAEGLAATRDHVVVAPAVPYGSSGEHAGFPGTLSIGQAALELVVVELVRSAGDFATVVLVSAHGGNAAPLARAVATLVAEGRRVCAWAPRTEVLAAVRPGVEPGRAPGPGGITPDGQPPPAPDAHAGRVETSLLLAVDPGVVRLELAEAGNRAPLAELAPRLRDGGVAAVSANGVLGDPAGASAAEGRAMFEALVADLVAAVDRLGPPAGPPACAAAGRNRRG